MFDLNDDLNDDNIVLTTAHADWDELETTTLDDIEIDCDNN